MFERVSHHIWWGAISRILGEFELELNTYSIYVNT
jgi:hypothetical protein